MQIIQTFTRNHFPLLLLPNFDHVRDVATGRVRSEDVGGIGYAHLSIAPLRRGPYTVVVGGSCTTEMLFSVH